jgi:hypothetical protein
VAGPGLGAGGALREGFPVAAAGVLRAMDGGWVVLVVVPVRACGGTGSGLGGCWRGAAA